MRRKIFTKKFWKKGSAEMMSFIALAPTMLILFALLVSVVQATSFKEKLEYTTYVAARAASLSDTISEARSNAKKAASANLSSYGDVYEPGSLRVQVSSVAGTKWKKGGYMKCKVSVRFKGITTLVNGKKSFEMVMAVEKPDSAKEAVAGTGGAS